jgi:hypothetical protein
MDHISSLELENFRTFRRPVRFDFAPLTILTGPNSSGKSSVIKALLLLRESLDRASLTRLDFSPAPHRLTSFAGVRSHGAEGPMRFVVRLPDGFGHDLRLRFPESSARPASPPPGGRPTTRSFDWAADAEIDLRFTGSGLDEIVIRAVKGEEGTEICHVRTRSGAGNGDLARDAATAVTIRTAWFAGRLGPDPAAILERLEVPDDAATRRFVKGLARDETIVLHDQAGVSLEAILHALKDPAEEAVDSTNGSGATVFRKAFLRHTVHAVFRHMVEALGSAVHSIEYSGEWKHGRPRVYQLDENRRSFAWLLRKLCERGGPGPEVVRWLRDFRVADELTVREVETGVYSVTLSREGHALHGDDIGTGHFSLVPMILHLDLTGNGATLLLEEPEANLHPNLQSRLADLFVTLVGHGAKLDRGSEEPGENRQEGDLPTKRLIVETHSEYLIRRLQYLVATGRVNPDLVAIYYLGDDAEAEHYVRRVSIAPTGQLTVDFGSGFIDEATNLMVDLYRVSGPG